MENDGLPEGLPTHTLGWDLLDWGTRMLAMPEGIRMGERWVYSDSQALFVLWFYAVDEFGKFVYRRGLIELPKGSGKSPFMAAIALTEFLGPTQFAGWDPDTGRPIGKPRPSPYVQVAAISENSADNTFSPIREMAANGELPYYYPELEIWQGKLTYPGSRKLERVTSSPRGREGNRATFVVMDEVEHWVPANQGDKLYDTLTRNLTKMSGRWIQTGNAPTPGENSVGELTHIAYENDLANGRTNTRLLVWSKSAYVEDLEDEPELRRALTEVYGDSLKVFDEDGEVVSGWVDLDEVVADILDPQTLDANNRCYYLNQMVTHISSWLKASDWKKCEDRSIMLKVDDPIALGFRGHFRNGSTCLVACRLTDFALFNLSKPEWNPPEDDRGTWECDQKSVDAHVREIMETYNVKKLLCNPVSYQTMISEWYASYEDEVEEFWLSSNTKQARAVEALETAVKTRRVKWADQQINTHILNCHTRETPQGIVIRKDTKMSKRFIDAAQAAVIAFEAAALAIEDGGLNEPDNSFWTA